MRFQGIPPSRLPATAAVALAAAVLVGCRGPGGGARDGPTGNRAARGRGSAVESVGGAVRMRAQYEKTEVEGEDSRSRTLTREELELRAAGRLADARLFHYSLMGAVAAAQFREAGEDVESSVLKRYDARGDVVPRGPLSARLWARRDEGVSFVGFLDSLGLSETRVEEEGAGVSWSRGALRMDAEGSASDGSSRGITGERSRTETRARASVGYSPDRALDLRAAASTGNVSESYGNSDFDYTLSSVTAQGAVRSVGPGGRERASLHVDGESRRQDGDFEFEQDRVSARLLGRPSDRLTLGTGLAVSRFGSGARNTRSVAADANLGHRLYESLDTSVIGDYSRLSEDRGEIDQFGGALSFVYRKRTAFGLLTAGAGAGRHLLDEQVAPGTPLVLREPHVLVTAGLELLRQFDVVESSVVVRDAVGALVYVRGLDYDLQPRGPRTEIFRLPGSAVPDGSPVLVDYRYRSPGGRRIRTDARHFEIGLRPWDFLHLYGRVSRSEQTEERGEVSGVSIEDVTHLSTGVEVQHGGFSAAATREDHVSSLSSYEERSVRARLGGDLGPDTQGSLGARYSRSSFDEGEDLRTLSADGSLHAAFSPRASFAFTPGYRNERGRGLERNLLDLRLEVRYSVRSVDLRLSLYRQEGSLFGDRRELSVIDLVLERWF